MSCFLCSKEHFIKTRDLSYNLIISENTYFCYWDSVNISATNSSILEYVNKNIIELIIHNLKSVNDKYEDNEKYINYLNEYIDEIETRKPKKIYHINFKDLVGLYNAYKCINYQIEHDYNKDYIINIQKLIADVMTVELSNIYTDNEVNKWEYEDV